MRRHLKGRGYDKERAFEFLFTRSVPWQLLTINPLCPMNKELETMAGVPPGPGQLSPGYKVMPKVVLLMISLLGILIIKNAGYNKIWFAKVGHYWDAFIEQKDAGLTPEQIKKERWSKPYVVSKAIEAFFRERNIKDPVILLEPDAYLQQVNGFGMPEPVVFYFFTGLKSLRMYNSNLKEATYMVYLKRGRLFFQPIKSPLQLQQILQKYKSFPLR